MYENIGENVMIIKSKFICTPTGIVDGYLTIANGVIQEITSEDRNESVDYSSAFIIPGLIDTHNHASGGYSIYGDTEAERFLNTENYLKSLASFGVTSVLPTLFSTEADEESFVVLNDITQWVNKKHDGAKVIGINLEGPYLNRVGEKGQRYKPTDINLDMIQRYLDISSGTLIEMGLAPELGNSAEAIALLLNHQVVVAFAHSDCNAKEAFDAFDQGVSVSTHVGNVMVGMHHREVGGLGASLLDDRVYCELICDGLHICNDMINIILKVKGYDKVMVISDSSRFVGMPPGVYTTENGTITLDKLGRVLDENGSLCGSSKSLLYGVKNLVQNVGCTLVDAVNMASLVPATKFGFLNKGSIEIGKDADFVIINEDFSVVSTYSEGKCIYDYKSTMPIQNTALLRNKQQ